MDPQSNTPGRKSGIPRPSKLPTRLPQPTTGRRKVHEPQRLRTETAVNSVQVKTRPSNAAGSGNNGFEFDHSGEVSQGHPDTDASNANIEQKRSRLSLSDRTVETLASIPPSASPACSRSSVFASQDPLTSPIRPSSSRYTRNTKCDHASIDSPPQIPHRRPTRPKSKHPPRQEKISDRDDTADIPEQRSADAPSPKSSAALRQTIARAKAAHRALSGSTQQSHASDTANFPAVELGGNSKSISSLIATAREKGQLNIPNMGLRALPKELLSMYEASSFGAIDSSWAQSVDLVKLNAADNDIENLDRRFLPGEDDTEENDGSFVLETLESLDLHGNKLVDLPDRLPQLKHLGLLNLSRNRLNAESLLIIRQMIGLKDLRLAGNNLKDVGSSGLDSLDSLEVLDLSENGLAVIPSTITTMTNLHTLILSGNKISDLPNSIFDNSQLRELQVARNNLKGCLIAPRPSGLSSLRHLDVSFNRLTSISEDPQMTLLNLQTFNISQNRVKTLPDLTLLQNLITLAADVNQLTELPIGLTALASLKNVDLSGNDIRQIDPHIGLMRELRTFIIANNPIRERRLLTMSTDELKRDMRSRLNDPNLVGEPGEAEAPAASSSDKASSSRHNLVLSGGNLDKSSSGLEQLDVALFEELIETNDVKSLTLKQNCFRSIPTSAVQTLSRTLTSLDLSNNKLGQTEYLSASLTLPRLKFLNLAANSLTTLLPLLSHLKADQLSEIDISRNRLGSLPSLRPTFARLSTIKAADNIISDLPYESVEGLEVLDVTGNGISVLEPRIGLLGKEGLRVFLVGANTFRVPRRDIVEKGTEAILTWLRSRIPDV